MRYLISLLSLIALLCILPTQAAAQFDAAAQSAQLITKTDETADNFSAWLNLPGHYDNIYCEFDLTAIDAGTVRVSYQLCRPGNVVAGDCTTSTVEQVGFGTSAMSATGQEYFLITQGENPAIAGGALDVELLSPIFPYSILKVDHTGSTASYTLDCMWW